MARRIVYGRSRRRGPQTRALAIWAHVGPTSDSTSIHLSVWKRSKAGQYGFYIKVQEIKYKLELVKVLFYAYLFISFYFDCPSAPMACKYRCLFIQRLIIGFQLHVGTIKAKRPLVPIQGSGHVFWRPGRCCWGASILIHTDRRID